MEQTLNIPEHVYTSGDKNNLPVIFLHGFPYDHTMWDRQVEFLKYKYYCITYDIRGLGKNVVPDVQYTLEDLVDDLINLTENLEIRKPVICGLSMGGYICLRAIEKAQDKFSGVILCDTKSADDDNAGRLKRAAAINAINRDGLEKYVAEAVSATFAGETMENNRDMYEDVLRKAQSSDAAGVKACILAMMGRTDTTGFLPEIKIPTLLISGSYDKLTPPLLMRGMCEKIPEAELAVAPRAAHMSPLENPEFVNDVISGFLDRRIEL